MNLSNAFKFARGNALTETVLSAGDYPASGSYIDVSGYPWVNVIIALGTIHASDLPSFTIKCSDATNGTADILDATYAAHTCAANDDGELVTFAIETAKLPVDHHFLTCAVAGVTNGSYADILFLLGPGLSQPVTQTTAVLPTASKYELAG